MPLKQLSWLSSDFKGRFLNGDMPKIFRIHSTVHQYVFTKEYVCTLYILLLNTYPLRFFSSTIIEKKNIFWNGTTKNHHNFKIILKILILWIREDQMLSCVGVDCMTGIIIDCALFLKLFDNILSIL